MNIAAIRELVDDLRLRVDEVAAWVAVSRGTGGGGFVG